jgi:hypothetical protein
MAGELWQSSLSVGREVQGTAEVQSLATTGTPTGGTFTLSYNGQTTSTIVFNAAASVVQAALRALPNVGSTLITCAAGPLPTAVSITFSGTLLGPQPLIVANYLVGSTNTLTGGANPTAVVTRTTAGVSSVGVAVAATRKAYFNTDLKLSRTRTPRPHAFMVGRRDNNLAVTLGPVNAGGTANFPISSSEIIEPLLCTIRGSVVPTSLAAGSAEVQTLTATNTPTGGTFTLAFLGQVTAPIAFNATAAAVGTALNLLSTITAAGGVGVPTGGPVNTTPVIITFVTVGNQPTIIGNGALLTGAGAQPAAVVVETTPGVSSANLWTFTPGAVLDTQTWQWFDGARAWNEVGVRGADFKITGSVGAETTVAMTLAGQNLVPGPLTSNLLDRTPDFAEGWETSLYIDALGNPPGTTLISGAMLSWEVAINNTIDYKYTADNTLAANAVLLGNLVCTAKIKFEAAPQAVATEYQNWDNAGSANPVLRTIRLSFGNNTILSGAFKTFVTVDLPGSWTMFDLGQTDGATRAYEAQYQYVYSPNDQFGVQFRCQNARTAAYV